MNQSHRPSRHGARHTSHPRTYLKYRAHVSHQTESAYKTKKLLSTCDTMGACNTPLKTLTLRWGRGGGQKTSRTTSKVEDVSRIAPTYLPPRGRRDGKGRGGGGMPIFHLPTLTEGPLCSQEENLLLYRSMHYSRPSRTRAHVSAAALPPSPPRTRSRRHHP